MKTIVKLAIAAKGTYAYDCAFAASIPRRNAAHASADLMCAGPVPGRFPSEAGQSALPSLRHSSWEIEQ